MCKDNEFISNFKTKRPNNLIINTEKMQINILNTYF